MHVSTCCIFLCYMAVECNLPGIGYLVHYQVTSEIEWKARGSTQLTNSLLLKAQKWYQLQSQIKGATTIVVQLWPHQSKRNQIGILLCPKALRTLLLFWREKTKVYMSTQSTLLCFIKLIFISWAERIVSIIHELEELAEDLGDLLVDFHEAILHEVLGQGAIHVSFILNYSLVCPYLYGMQGHLVWCKEDLWQRMANWFQLL